jgi:hypothetical protein
MLIIGLIAMTGAAFANPDKPRKEKAVVEFTQTVKWMDVLLKGEYLIVHDEEAMAQGKPCTYVYKGNKEQADKLILSFHCKHMDRQVAKSFVMRLYKRNVAYEIPEVQEFQFAGSAAGHAVP